MIHATAHNDGPRARLILQRRLLGLLALGFLGTGAELLLLGHTEGFWQCVPLVIIAFSLVTLALRAFRSGALSNRAFQIAMWLAMAGGLAGMALHFQANREFKLEMQPSLSGLPLVWVSLKKGLTPALAPGMLILLGLLGLLTISRPASAASAPTHTTTTKDS
jgi:hypothetical protein